MKSTVGQTFHGSQTLVTVCMPSWWALQGLGSSFPYHCHLRPKSVCEFFSDALLLPISTSSWRKVGC